MGSPSFAKLDRDSTKLTISEFYERYQLSKYNFDPEYQRRGDVWDEEKQSFLIDSILKNYPIPPIFLHQEVNPKNGATTYNIIDGKQRLLAILKYINNELDLPQDYDVGAFGDSRLNGKRFYELEGELSEFKMQFWRYSLSIEYIKDIDLEIINNVFDRLNRNGVPLEPQELRKARYYNTELIKLVEGVTKKIDWNMLGKVKVNRMQDYEFVSELVFFILEGEPQDASTRETLDISYKKWCEILTSEQINFVKTRFSECTSFINGLNLDFEKFKIKGVSHYYALFGFANYCVTNGINEYSVSRRLNKFYDTLRGSKPLDGYVKSYKESMQSNTRSKWQRARRIDALINSCK